MPKTTTPMASTTSSAPEDWIGDAVLGYLSSPLLRTPIENFLDNYCSLFEASEENKLEYQEIHQQFTEVRPLSLLALLFTSCLHQLVDSLLTAQLAEMSITAEQFESLARQIYSSKSAPQAQGMLESVLFYDDFLRTYPLPYSVSFTHVRRIQASDGCAEPRTTGPSG